MQLFSSQLIILLTIMFGSTLGIIDPPATVIPICCVADDDRRRKEVEIWDFVVFITIYYLRNYSLLLRRFIYLHCWNRELTERIRI